MDLDLKVIIVAVKACRLEEPSEILEVLTGCIPFDWPRLWVDPLDVLRQKKRTVFWYCINPFVESRVKLGDNMLLPMRPHKPKENLGLVNWILRQDMSTLI
jgi:hypothetical protein